jgi:hypothetical protein
MMMSKNYSENSLDKFSKKVLIINKIQNNDIPKIKKHTKLLFNDPSNYLKLPSELDLKFVIGKKSKQKQQIENRHNAKKYTGNFAKLLAKRMTKFRSSKSVSSDIKKMFDLNKKINDDQKNLLRKKILNIFSKYRNIINNNESNEKENNIELCSEIPTFMKNYITDKLSKQEKALKCRNNYNNIFKKIEYNISKTMIKDNKSSNNDKKTKKNSEHKHYETANLFKNSINNYRNKIEAIKVNDMKRKKNLRLDTNFRIWEKSLRRPKNFIGLRKSYLNASSDKRPLWIIATEKYPYEEEKIINPNISNSGIQSSFKENFLESSNKLLSRKRPNKIISLKKYKSLQIIGKKLIDFEETQADQLNGKIKILKYNYSHDSTKDLLFKMNCSINKHIFEQNNL